MKKWLAILVIACTGYLVLVDRGYVPPGPSEFHGANRALQDAQTRQLSDVQVTGQGVVVSILRDDTDGSRHQRFILDVGTGETVLISHNIDLAPRVENLAEGDLVEFAGEFEWNAKGGVVHWTHHDPAGRHPGGRIRHRGQTYR